MEKSRYPVTGVLLLCAFVGLIILLIFQAMKSTLTFFGAIVPAVILIYYYVTSMDYDIRGLRKAKNFVALDGTIGVVESEIMPEYGGRGSLTVAIKADACPNNLWYRMPGFKGLMAFLANRVHFDVTGPMNNFQDVAGKYSVTKEGTMFYLGSIDPERPVISPIKILQDELEETRGLLLKMRTIVEKSKTQSAADTREANQSMVAAMDIIVPMLNQFLDKTRPNVLQPGIQGGINR